jgi:hypothetical protein
VTIPAVKAVSRGIQAVEQRLLGLGNGPRLHFLRGSLVAEDEQLRTDFRPCSVEEEFDVYVWAKNGDGSVNKEEPKKEHDHGLDTVRYAVMYEDKDVIDPAALPSDQLRNILRQAQSQFATPSSKRGSQWL